MKRKILINILIILGLITITGCGSSNVKKENDEKKDEVIDKTLVEVNGVKLHINKEKEFKGIKYTITDELKEANQDYYVQYYLYQESGPNLLFFRIFYYEGKSHNNIKDDLAIDYNLAEEKGKNSNIEYTYIDTKREDGTIHYYLIDKGNITYVINFVSKYDIKDFEEKVLN